MSEEKDKKINYKILTTEHLLEEKETAFKEIKPKETEEVKPEFIEKIETKPEIKEPKTKELPIEISYSGSKEEETPYIPLKRPEEIEKVPTKKAQEEGEILEEKAELEIFYRPQKERPIIIPKKEKPEKVEEIKKRKPSLVNYLLIFLGLSLLGFFIFVFKPYEKLKAFLFKKEIKLEEEISQPSTPTPIIFPEIKPETPPTPTPSEIAKIEEEVPKKEEPIISQPKAEEKFIQPTFIFPTKELSFITFFPSKKIQLSELSFSQFEKEVNALLAKQELAGSLFSLDFSFADKKAPFNFIFNYFIKPTKISEERIKKFKEEFSGNYAFMLYYSYTRKYPFLIFEIKNPQVVKLFNQEWEEENMINDLKTLFFGIDPGKPLRNYFVTEEIEGLPYRIIYFDNNYKLIWTVTSNYLIYASTENGLRKIVSAIAQ